MPGCERLNSLRAFCAALTILISGGTATLFQQTRLCGKGLSLVPDDLDRRVIDPEDTTVDSNPSPEHVRNERLLKPIEWAGELQANPVPARVENHRIVPASIERQYSHDPQRLHGNLLAVVGAMKGGRGADHGQVAAAIRFATSSGTLPTRISLELYAISE